jgi:hypothetical protein
MRCVIVGLAVLVLMGAATSAWTTPEISLDVKDASIASVVKTISEKGKLDVILDEAVGKKKVTLSLAGTPPEKALKLVAMFASAKLIKLGEDTYWLGPKLEDWQKKAWTALATTKLNFNFQGTSLEDALGFCANMSKVPMVVDPAVFASRKPDTLELTMAVEKINLRQALSLMTELLSLSWDVRWGVVFVSTKKRLAALPLYGMSPPPTCERPEGETKLRKRLATERVAFDFSSTTLAMVLEFIHNVRKLPILAEDDVSKALAAASVTCRVSEITVGQALDVVLIPRGFRYEVTEKGVVVKKAK